MGEKIDLVACCYEKFLFGFTVEEEESASLKKARAKSHTQPWPVA